MKHKKGLLDLAVLMILAAMMFSGCGLKLFTAQTPEGTPLSTSFQVAYKAISASEEFYLGMYRDINSACKLGLIAPDDCAKYTAMLDIYEGTHNSIVRAVSEWYKMEEAGKKYDKSELIGMVLKLVPEARKIVDGLAEATDGKADLRPPPAMTELMEVLIGSATIG